MKILAIDGATKNTGWAVFENENLIDFNKISINSSSLIKRIYYMVEEIDKIIDKYKIDKIILEEVVIEKGKNNKTYKALMWLQAAINFLIYNNYPKVKVEYVYPSAWRKVCGIKTGTGVCRPELKQSDISFVEQYYKINIKGDDDIADAIGIGHYFLSTLNIGYNWE